MNEFEIVSGIFDSVRKYNLPMFIVPKTGEPIQIGTFILLSFSSKYYLITAAHVANQCAKDGFYTFIDAELVQFTGKIVKTTGDDADDKDIALLQISDDVNIGELPFITDEMFTCPSAPLIPCFAFIGYPATKTKIKKPDSIIKLNMQLYYNFLCSKEVYNNLKLSHETHIAIKFEKKKCFNDFKQQSTFPDPQGMSGGGIWQLDLTNKKALLAGVATKNDKKEKCLLGTRVSLVMHLLSKF